MIVGPWWCMRSDYEHEHIGQEVLWSLFGGHQRQRRFEAPLGAVQTIACGDMQHGRLYHPHASILLLDGRITCAELAEALVMSAIAVIEMTSELNSPLTAHSGTPVQLTVSN